MRKILLLLVILVVLSVSAFAQGVFPEILKRMDTHQKSLKTLQADITITKFSAQLGGTYAKEGVIKFVPQANEYWIKIDSTKPATESFLIIKNEYLLYLPSLKTSYTGTTTDSQKNILFIFLNLSKANLKANLKANYSIRYIGQEKVNGTILAWHLELTPTKATNYKTADLWINADGMAIQSKVVENNGDWTTVLLENPQKNIVMNGNEFKIDLPKGTKIIKN